jgi:hypothetical protein
MVRVRVGIDAARHFAPSELLPAFAVKAESRREVLFCPCNGLYVCHIDNRMEVIGMDVDLKLLMILDEVYKTGSVSRAGANIGMTQPSISIALAKLRNIFNDPLFVRTSRGMEPTPHAIAVMKPVGRRSPCCARRWGSRSCSTR